MPPPAITARVAPADPGGPSPCIGCDLHADPACVVNLPAYRFRLCPACAAKLRDALAGALAPTPIRPAVSAPT